MALFDALLRPPVPPIAVLWFHGPGGIGKTTLIGRLKDRARSAGRRAVTLDGALLEPQARQVEEALGADDPREAADPGVLFIDSCERLAPLEPWLRQSFLPSLPASWLVVVAGRQLPSSGWRHDASWVRLLRTEELCPLDEAAAASLLAARGVPPSRRPQAIAYARGHPLALSLVAELLCHDGADSPELPAGSEAVQTLVQRFTREAVHPAQRDALRLAAFARHTTEALLAAVLGRDSAPTLFDWLRSLSFVRATPAGLLPHELVRDVLFADAMWRDPQGSQALCRAAYRHCYDMIACSEGRQRVHYQAEAIYTQRHMPHKQKFFDWEALDAHRVEPARDEDLALLEGVVRRHEGDASLHWLRYWWHVQRAGFRVFWNGAGGCDGFLLMLRLGAGASAGDRADPAVAAAWSFITGHRALAGADEMVLLRYWMHGEKYQAVTAAINLTSMHVMSHLITHPEAAWSVVYMADPVFWQPHFDGVNFARCPDADFEVDGHRFGAFVHDWRFEPAAAWTAGDHRPMPFSEHADATAPDSEAAFVEAVRQALRHYTDDMVLRRCDLASRLGLPVDVLRARLCEGVLALGKHPRGCRFRDALWQTYIEPKHKQEQVAADLGVPFTTYRYRLQQGVERLAAALRSDS